MSEHQTNLLDGRDDRDGLHNLIDDLDSEDWHKMRPTLVNNADNRIAFSMKISAKKSRYVSATKTDAIRRGCKLEMESTF